MAQLGRAHAGDPGLPSLLDGLTGESEYHHRLALVAAEASGDEMRLRTALAHSSPRVRAFAFAHLGPRAVAPDTVLRVFLEGSAEDRRRLRRFVKRTGRTDIAEVVIDEIRRELGDGEAGALLAACGDATVRRLLPEMRYAMASLASLARRHPGPVLDYLEDALAVASPGPRDSLWLQMGTALDALATVDPERILRLVEEHGPSNVIPYGLYPSLGRLIRLAPARVAPLLVREEYVGSLRRHLPSALRANARSFTHVDRVAIARALREHEVFFLFIGRLAPGDRGRVFAEALTDLDTSTTIWSPGNLEVLPRAVRHAEARRILSLRAIRESDTARLTYSSFLPLSEARAVLAPELIRSRAEDRAAGYGLLIACARRERSADALTEALRSTGRLRHEQDPVRLAAVQALESVSPNQIADEHLDDLGALVRAAIDARDTSPATIHNLTSVAFGLIVDAARDPDSERSRFALAVLDDLAGLGGSLTFPPVARRLPPRAAISVVDALMPRLEVDAGRDRYGMALALAETLNRRAWGHVGLQAIIEGATSAANESVVRTAVGLWLSDPRTRSGRVGRLVAKDESTVVLPAVLDTITGSRQELLDVVLRRRPLRGRFLKGDVRDVPLMNGPFDRWLPRQVDAYRSALGQLIDTPGGREWSKYAAIGLLARLPVVGAEAVRPYLLSGDVAVQEAALAGLAWTDRPGAALDELLAYAGGDRARVAVYAASRCARFVPRRDLGPPLMGLVADPAAKVTSRKEAARLLGMHRPPGAVDALMALGLRDDSHPDLRIAIGRALRGALDDERVWAVFARIAAGADDEARSLLQTGPTQIPPRHRSRYAEFVLAATRSGREQVRSEALGLLGSWAPWATSAPAVAVAAIEDLDVGREWRRAVDALPCMMRDGSGWEEVDELVATLAGRADASDLDAGTERDRPSCSASSPSSTR